MVRFAGRETAVAPQTGLIDTFAGSGAPGYSGDGGDCLAARFNAPYACALDHAASLFVADSLNHRVRLIDLLSLTVELFAGTGKPGFSGDGGPARKATFNEPSGLAVAASGDLYVCDRRNRRVRRIEAATGIVETIAGNGELGSSGDDGPATDASLVEPVGIALDGAGGLYICDIAAQRVRRVDLESGLISTVIGSGEAAPAVEGVARGSPINAPAAAAADGAGGIYLLESGAHRILNLTAEGIISVRSGSGEPGLSGDDGPAELASYQSPLGLATDPAGSLYVADTGNHAVRVITSPDSVIHRVAGGRPGFSGDGGEGRFAALDGPGGCISDAEGTIYIADTGNHRIRIVEGFGPADEPFGDDSEVDQDLDY